jgi:hypothetical protein
MNIVFGGDAYQLGSIVFASMVAVIFWDGAVGRPNFAANQK